MGKPSPWLSPVTGLESTSRAVNTRQSLSSGIPRPLSVTFRHRPSGVPSHSTTMLPRCVYLAALVRMCR